MYHRIYMIILVISVVNFTWTRTAQFNDDNFLVELIRRSAKQLFAVNYGNFVFRDSYDFIIVGSGPAGCVLANRLSENVNTTVLLLEAGDAELSVLNDVMMGAPMAQSTAYNWGYETEPQTKACLAMKNNRCKWPHGRGMGGSTLLNYMLYTRGNRRDFDRWSGAGNTGWSYEEVLPFYIKSENSFVKKFESNGYHGHKGPLNVEDIPFRTEIAHAFVKSARQYGLPFVDYNAREQLGVSYFQSTTKSGWRFTAAESFLHPVLVRPNLHISPKSWVTKLIINQKDSSKVDGVTFVKDHKEFTIKADKEVVLSAGAFESPKLLMLSGIGPSRHLSKLGIKVVKDLPVGETLFEHVAVFGPTYIASNVHDGLINADSVIKPEIISEWYKGRGILTANGVESVAYVKTNMSADLDLGFPDVEIMESYATIGFDTSPSITAGLGMREEIFEDYFRPLQTQRAFSFLPMLLHPKSVGNLTLQSTNPFHHPILNANFFDDPQDIKAIIAAIRIIQEILKQKSFMALGVRQYEAIVPGCEEHSFDTDKYWECAIIHLTATLHHQVGTCRMGPKSDAKAVVDETLRVHGFGNLRVADVGIIPQPPSGHTAAFSFMIGEKAADMIKKDWHLHNSNLVRKRSVSFDSNFTEVNASTEHQFNSAPHTTEQNHARAEPKQSILAILSSHIGELTTTTVKSKIPLDMLSDEIPSLNEDMVRTYTVKNGSTYGKGKEKAKFITKRLEAMNFTEIVDGFARKAKKTVCVKGQSEKDTIALMNLTTAKHEATEVKEVLSRRKREWFGFGSSSSGIPQAVASDRNDPSFMRVLFSNAWKSINHGMFRMAEYTRNLMVPIPQAETDRVKDQEQTAARGRS